jgi:hypothetical protein
MAWGRAASAGGQAAGRKRGPPVCCGSRRWEGRGAGRAARPSRLQGEGEGVSVAFWARVGGKSQCHAGEGMKPGASGRACAHLCARRRTPTSRGGSAWCRAQPARRTGGGVGGGASRPFMFASRVAPPRGRPRANAPRGAEIPPGTSVPRFPLPHLVGRHQEIERAGVVRDAGGAGPRSRGRRALRRLFHQANTLRGGRCRGNASTTGSGSLHAGRKRSGGARGKQEIND